MSETLHVEQQDGLCRIVLKRPEKMNALSADLVEALIDAVDRAHAAGSQAIVFQGEGKNFSAGFDFGGYAEQSEGDLVLRFVRLEQLLQKVASSSALTVALAHGKNFGAGVDLFGACRVRVATPDASFRMPGLKFGLVLGTRRFAALVGAQTAHDVLLHTRTFSAEAALNMGFATRLATTDEWDDVRLQTAASARELSPATLGQLHAVLNAHDADADLADLVRSAAAPGLKHRIQAYLNP
ncbi:MAG: enoyl-CoA hydratase/isomerase family protein [Comamonadaceae bacterium]|nr:MAG: enoyl-CoA hydratase/isomerase family protein [Comamonadaceae bacterium]